MALQRCAEDRTKTPPSAHGGGQPLTSHLLKVTSWSETTGRTFHTDVSCLLPGLVVKAGRSCSTGPTPALNLPGVSGQPPYADTLPGGTAAGQGLSRNHPSNLGKN